MNNEQLVNLYQSGDVDVQVLNVLIEKNKGLIAFEFKKFYINSISYTRKDLLQEGKLGLISSMKENIKRKWQII